MTQPSTALGKLDQWLLENVGSREAEQVWDIVTAAINTERKAIANALCRECKSGYAPTYDPSANYYYHHVGSESEIGCTASAVHSRTRNAS